MKQTAPVLDTRSHFGLTETPFTREIAVADRWPCTHLDEARDDLARVVDQRQSGALVGPAGSGKTALLRALVEDLPEARYRVHYVKVTSLSKRDMTREIALAADVPPAGSFPGLFRRLQDRFLSTQDNDGIRSVLILDEAQDLRPDVLGLVRVITNFQMDSRLVLSVILAGQPPLLAVLKRDDLESVARRLTHCVVLRLLSRGECRQYMEHRMRVAGARQFPFDDPSTDAVYEITRGNLRAIDTLCGKALEIAAEQGHPTVGAATVAAARQKLP
ncbi:MAG: AAA family ATPase [Thermoanaerobaculaceae bacterium]|nr:AAA family ATPase [Thermoanaerobaculaceae bacterium]